MYKIYRSANIAWIDTVRELGVNGSHCAPRGKNIREIKNFSIAIDDPKKRIISNPIRKISLPFAFGELCWYLQGKNDVETMEYYSPKMKTFSDDGKTLNSAYGHRIFGKHPAIGFNQWNAVVNKLNEDPDSRQAIIHLHTPNNIPTKDEVCTLTLQFMIRDGKLDMITNMRSNDIIWGFTYDVFSFTTFQELIANELDIEMGTYYHNVASMHIYEKDYYYIDLIEKYYDELKYLSLYDFDFDYGGKTIHSRCFNYLFDFEAKYRNSKKRIDAPALTESQEKISCILQLQEGVPDIFDVMVDVFKNMYLYRMGFDMDHLQYDNIYDLMQLNYFSGIKIIESTTIIIEGPDGVGKTHKANSVHSFEGNTTLIHFKKPDNNFNSTFYFYLMLMSGNKIFDRSFISEVVYSKFLNRPSFLKGFEYDMLLDLISKTDCNVISLLPENYFEREVILKRLSNDDKNLIKNSFDLEIISYMYRNEFKKIAEHLVISSKIGG